MPVHRRQEPDHGKYYLQRFLALHDCKLYPVFIPDDLTTKGGQRVSQEDIRRFKSLLHPFQFWKSSADRSRDLDNMNNFMEGYEKKLLPERKRLRQEEEQRRHEEEQRRRGPAGVLHRGQQKRRLGEKRKKEEARKRERWTKKKAEEQYKQGEGLWNPTSLQRTQAESSQAESSRKNPMSLPYILNPDPPGQQSKGL
jgi:hypothetical protein